MGYKAVIFDLDGTLLNTLDDLADSANYVLEKLGCPTHPVESYKYFVGNGIPKLIERCLPPDKQELKNKALELFSAYYSKHSEDKTAPYSQIPQLLDELRERGYKLGIITNKANNISQQVVSHFFGENTFDCVQGLEEGLKAKPDSAGALKVAQTLSVSPENVLYIGDSGVDMQTAVNAGFTPCGVLWGFRKRDELLENGAKIIVESPLQILEYTPPVI